MLLKGLRIQADEMVLLSEQPDDGLPQRKVWLPVAASSKPDGVPVQILQDAEGQNGKPGNAIIAALAAAVQSLKMAGAMVALAKTMKKDDDQH